MLVLVVSIDILPEHTDEFIAATLENARGSRTEPGNLRFDVLRAEDDPNHFTLYEVYASDEALAAHRESPHYQRWAAAAVPWMARPRTRVISRTLFFGDAAS
ncbi:putative quinol monooxygenase [Kouleothrix sp.]|uniref:putative quinol monooxygenase n=1 Tax=Kouleothrix sp. TaxID=2779161 RepID=UPI00391DCA09